MFIVKLLSGIVLIGSVAWCVAEPGYEPAIAIITSLIAFIGVWFIETKIKNQADQNQSVAENGIGIQTKRDVNIHNTGLSLAEVRVVALDIAKATFYELSGEAKETASVRVEEITDKVLQKLKDENPDGLQKATDPDFQYALFTVQKEYARSGDKDLGDLLVDLLVDRSKCNQRSMLQIALNESLSTATKLTEINLATLAVRFQISFTRHTALDNHQILGEYLDKYLLPFVPKLSKNNTNYQHIEFTSCGSIGTNSNNLEEFFENNYPSLFRKGFDQSEITGHSISVGFDTKFFIECLNDPSTIQVSASFKGELEDLFNKNKIPPEDRVKILALFDHNKMSGTEIKEKVIYIRPYMADVFEIWNNSVMNRLILTSVGMAIGHANIKRMTGDYSDLSIWFDD